MHYGSADACDPLLDPHMFDDHLDDIRDSHAVNQLCFFLVLVGDDARPAPPPVHMDAQLYRALLDAAADADGKALLQRWVGTAPDGRARIKNPR